MYIRFCLTLSLGPHWRVLTHAYMIRGLFPPHGRPPPPYGMVREPGCGWRWFRLVKGWFRLVGLGWCLLDLGLGSEWVVCSDCSVLVPTGWGLGGYSMVGSGWAQDALE